MSEGFWPNFDQINISHRRPCSLWIVNLLTWQKAPEGGYDEKSWEMACNWLMMTSSGDDNRPSGSLGLLTDKTKKKIKKINWWQSKKPPSLRLRGLTRHRLSQHTSQVAIRLELIPVPVAWSDYSIGVFLTPLWMRCYSIVGLPSRH